MSEDEDKPNDDDFSELIDAAKTWGNTDALFGAKKQRSAEENAETEDTPLLSEERKQLLLSIHEFVKKLLGHLYGEHKLLVAASAGSMKDILLTANPKEAIMIDQGKFIAEVEANDVQTFLQRTKTDEYIKGLKREYIQSYKKNEPHGHVATVNLPDKAGRLGFILWELEELGVDTTTISDPIWDNNAWTLEFDYQHPSEDQATRRKISYMETTTSNIMLEPTLTQRLEELIGESIQVILQKAAEEAYAYPEFQDLLFQSLSKNGIILSDRFETLKNKVAELRQFKTEEFPQELQKQLKSGIFFGYYNELLIAQKQ